MTEKKRILWVEDEVGTIKGTVRSARRRDCDVMIAESTAEAVNLLKDEEFDLLIVDFRIPKDSGSIPIKGEGINLIKSVLNQCKNKEYLKKRVLLLTAQLASYRKESLLGSDDCFEVMEKPGSHLKVLNWIKKAGNRVE